MIYYYPWSINTALDAVIGHARCDDYDDCNACEMHDIEDGSDYSCTSLAADAAEFLVEWRKNLPEGTILENLTLEDLI
jgi:hypothetical protein